MKVSRYVWLHDKMIKEEDAHLPFFDRGYYFGDGVYEVIRIYSGKPFMLTAHWKRLERSASEINIEMTVTKQAFSDIIFQLKEKNEIHNGYVYFQMTRGIEERQHLYSNDLSPVITAFAKESDIPLDKQKHGVSLWAMEDIRWLRCDIKTIHLLANVMAKNTAFTHGAEEALLHRGNTVTEGASTNIFLVKNGVIYTHPADNYILNGITRQVVIELAKENRFPLKEKPFSLIDISENDEMFITSTTLEIVPVTCIRGSIEVTLQPGIVTRKLQAAFQAREK